MIYERGTRIGSVRGQITIGLRSREYLSSVFCDFQSETIFRPFHTYTRVGNEIIAVDWLDPDKISQTRIFSLPL